jgi:ribosome-associated protein
MIQLPDINQLLDECRFEATRSSGSGGQNVNKVSTKVILLFNVFDSKVLNADQKEVFASALSTRISKAGVFRISSGRERTQLANRKLIIEKFASLVTNAFATEEDRIATSPTAGSKRERIARKKVHSVKKINRQRWDGSDDD